MAQFTTNFVPDSISFAPSEEKGNQAKLFLEGALSDYPITEHRYSTPSFITSGSNFEKFTCPSCKKLVKLHSLSEEGQHWWYTVLWDLRDEDQIITVPCCGAPLAVRQFDFGRDAAFARFRLSVEGLGEDEGITAEQLATLEIILGCRMRQIIEVDG